MNEDVKPGDIIQVGEHKPHEKVFYYIVVGVNPDGSVAVEELVTRPRVGGPIAEDQFKIIHLAEGSE